MTATIKVSATVREQDVSLVLNAMKADLQTAQQVCETMQLQGTAYDTKASGLISVLNTLCNRALAWRHKQESGVYSYALTEMGSQAQSQMRFEAEKEGYLEELETAYIIGDEATIAKVVGPVDNGGSEAQPDVPVAQSKTGGVAMPGKEQLEQAIMNTLIFSDEPMTKAGILRASGIKQAGGQLTQAFARLVESGAIVPVADGYKASDEAREAAGVEVAAPVIGAKGKGKPVVDQAEAVVAAKASKGTITEERAAELQELAERVAGFDPAEGTTPIELKSECEALSVEERRATRAFVIMVPGTDSGTNGARFRMLGLLTKDDVTDAQTKGTAKREKVAKEKKERKVTPKAAPTNVLQFTPAYKAQDTSICSIAAMAVYNGAAGTKALGREAIVEALKAARPEDGEKYAKEGLALLVKREVLVANKDKEGKIVGYSMPADVRKGIATQLKAREQNAAAVKATDEALAEA